MLTSLAKAAQALAVWRVAETGATHETTNQADLKGAAVRAHDAFENAAYELAFELAAWLVRHGTEVTTVQEVRYSTDTREGGFVVQKMNLDPDNLGAALIPGAVSTEQFMQLIIDLPELIKILGVQA